MRDVIQICIDLDTVAVDTYSQLSAACDDRRISTLFAQMGKEETAHVGWWTDLLEAWESGLVPPPADEGELRETMRTLAADIAETLPTDYTGLSVDQMLTVAAHLEFYMLDPAFGELIDLVRPTEKVDVRDAYSRHIMRLVGTIEERHSRHELSHFLARALARSLRDQQRLSRLATQDPLTALYNRRGFYGYLQQWVSYSTRYGHPVSVVLIDIDKFKTINDRFGHPAGDMALQTVASALRSAVRGADIVGRYGGDEFAILAPETNRDDLVLLMERVLDAIRGTEVILGATTERVSVSVGGAFVSDGIPVTPEQMLAAADQALYEAKAKGRNCAAPPRSAVDV